MRSFLIAALFALAANASLLNYTYNKKDVEILKSFDIDTSFLFDSHFSDMKNSVIAGYKKDRFFSKFEEGYLFIPILKDMIKEAGIPPEFLYLAMAESEFSVRAYSRKHAAGLWQFMPATGRHYGLRIDAYVDERRDPIKSTKAAIEFLKDLHERFGKWYLAAIAYNCGPGRLNWAIKKAGSDELSALLDTRKRYLPRESRNYIRKIISLAMAFNSVDLIVDGDFGHFLNRGAGYPLVSVTLGGGTHLFDVAKSMGLSTKELRAYNRHLRYDFVPNVKEGYDIYIPYRKVAEFRENYDPTKQGSKFMVHIVERGDTLSDIGDAYGVPWRIIRDANNLKNSFLKINQKIVIPIVTTFEGKKPKQYRVKNGDTIYGIARRFNTSVDDIMIQNSLSSNLIRPGDTIVIPN